MTTSINWPPSLPAYADVSGYGEKHGVLVSVTPMDSGPPKIRKRGNKPTIISVEYTLNTEQVVTFETFVKTTLTGVKRFNWQHPRTYVSVEVRLVPSSDGEFYTLKNIGPTTWVVSLALEVLP